MSGLATVAVACLLFLYSVPLRVVAPCEIVPEEPQVVAAPLEGVINQVWVQPGDKVKKGDLLFTYEDRILMQELKVAQKQVEIIRAQYERMRLRAFQDNMAMEEVRSLKYRLEQEEIRLKLAEANAGYLEVRAPIDGICMLDDPENWQGRPVQVGERVVQLFQPQKGKVRLFLPENDYIQFDWNRPVKVILIADPGSKRDAWLSYVSPQASKNHNGGASFVAEAHLANQHAGIRIGSKGSAIVSGEEVSLGYWLARKPLAGMRQFLGI
jgi:multidrug resistance efflux pump